MGEIREDIEAIRFFSTEESKSQKVTSKILEQIESRNSRHFYGSSCGKCILAGEHSVVYGGYCVCTPLRDLELKVDFCVFKQDDDRLRGSSKFFTKGSKEVHDILYRMFKTACNLLEINIKEDILLDIDSHFPLGAGLGGSAAISQAILDALTSYSGKLISLKQKLDFCNELEKINHLSPSGVDSYVVVTKEALLFKKQDPRVRTPICLGSGEFDFLLVDSNQRSKTSEMIEKVKGFFSSGSLVKEFDKFTLETKEALESRNLELMSRSLNGVGTLLKNIGLYTPEIEEIETKLKQEGVLAVKPTGACGGGMVLCLLDPRVEGQQLRIKDIFGCKRVFKFKL